MGIGRTIKYFAQGAYSRIDPNYRRDDEFGECSICGNYSRYKLGKVLEPGSDMAVSCGWDEEFVREINAVNTLKCSYCMAKFRVRCAAASMLRYFWKGEVRCVSELVKKPVRGGTGNGWQALETTACDGIFSGFSDASLVTRSEYFDDVGRGGCKNNNIRSEDLQALTFPDNSFDVIIALDVFEHIADPMKAFSEVRRVIKPSGIGIITFPIDERVKNTRRLTGQAFHSDPLRKNGSRVFTEFGTDIVDILASSGYKASWDIYKTERSGIKQRVLVLGK